MTDSTATYERCIDDACVALGAGDRAAADLALRAAIRATERNPDGQLQLAAALIKLGELRHDEGDPSEAEGFLRRALQVSERALGSDDLGLVAPLMSLGAAVIARGAPDEAEPLLTRALTISEQNLGHDHPDLAGLLNDLSRLYLKQGAHSYAEPLLLRLHAIKRSKGDDHPEVATVLASLAAVRQALGRHEAAEQLWRRVLEIRERTLAPNHFAIATALEHLAETCAARGKLDEALRLYQRSVGMREVTLGAGHASVRAARERIADLRLQGSEIGLVLDGADTRSPLPDWRSPLALPPGVRTPTATGIEVARPLTDTPRLSLDLGRVHAEPPRPSAEVARPPASDFGRSPYDFVRPSVESTRPVADRSPVIESRPAPAPRREAPAVLEVEPFPADSMNALRGVVAAASQPPMPLVMPYGDAATYDDESYTDTERSEQRRGGAFIAPLAAIFRKRPFLVVGAGAAAVTLMLVAALQGNSLSGSETSQPSATSTFAASPSSPVAPLVVDSTAARAGTANGGGDSGLGDDDLSTSSRSRPTTSSSSSSAGRPESRAPSTPTAQKTVDVPLPRISDIPGSARNAVNAQLDSVMRSLSTGAVASTSQSFTASRSLPTMEPSRSRSNAEIEASTAFQSPRLIGSIPRTRYPTSLRSNRVEGEVVVEFSVDTPGRPDMATLTVVRSAHELFTAAVREVVPTMRFVPAQAGGQKTRAGVQVPFRFSVDRQE